MIKIYSQEEWFDICRNKLKEQDKPIITLIKVHRKIAKTSTYRIESSKIKLIGFSVGQYIKEDKLDKLVERHIVDVLCEM